MSGTVLLVEDERDTREMLGRALSRAGYEPLLCEDGTDALAVARESRVDVVVSDIVMGIDSERGLRLIGELRAQGVRAPVVIITAHADVHKVKVALNEGAAHLLEKPFTAAELVRAIERVRKTEAPEAVEALFTAARLTDKERTVARQLLLGLSSNEIAERERNSPRTIRQHVSQIYAKCGVRSRAEFFRLVYGH